MTVRHPEFRVFDRWRVEMNDGGIALLIAARIGRQAIDRAGSHAKTSYLTELFPTIPEIGRLHVRPRQASDLMAEAEMTYAHMAIPFIVAILNDYLVTIGELLVRADLWRGKRPPDDLFLGPLRDAISKSGLGAPPPYPRLMDFVQAVRNTIIHAAGVATPALQRKWTNQSADAKATWSALAGRPPAVVVGKRMALGPPEITASWAVTHRVAVGLNDSLGDALPRQLWSQIAAEDYRSENPEGYRRRDRRLRSAVGFARLNYGPLNLTAADVRPYLG